MSHAGLATVLVFALAGCYSAAPVRGPEARADWARSLLTPCPARPAGACPASPVSLAQAEALALGGHPALRAAAAGRRAAAHEAEAPQAREPELRVGTVRLDEVLDGAARFGVGVRARFEAPGTLDAKTDAAREEARLVAAEADDLARTQLAAVRSAHAGALAARALAEAAVAGQGLAETRAARRERAAAAGTGTRAEADQATLELAAARDATMEARAEVALAEAALGSAMGAPAGCAPTPAGELTAIATRAAPESLEVLTGRALARRPAVVMAEARIGRAAARRFIAERARWPWLDFAQLEYEAGEGAEPTRWGLSVAVTLPVFRLGGGEVEARESEVWLARAEAERDVAAVADEVARARRAVEVASARLEAVRQAAASYPEARLETLRAAAVQGEVDLNAVEAVTKARLGLTRREIAAARALREAWVALDLAVGEPAAAESVLIY